MTSSALQNTSGFWWRDIKWVEMPMEKVYQHPRSHLFTVRVWEEEVGSGQTEWRGKAQLMTSGDVRYFRHWAALVPLLVTMLGTRVSARSDTRDAFRRGI